MRSVSNFCGLSYLDIACTQLITWNHCWMLFGPHGLLLMYKSMNYNTFHVTFMYVYKCMSIRGLVPTLQYNYTIEVKR